MLTDLRIEQLHKEIERVQLLGSPFLESIASLRVLKQIYLRKDLPLFIIVYGMSGVGKDMVIQHAVNLEMLQKVRSCTTRKPRKDEDPNSYIWMNDAEDKKLPTESIEAYEERLTEKYKLIEFSLHDGNFYGINEQSIEEAITNKRSTLIKTDINGAFSLKKLLVGRANTVIICIHPADPHQFDNVIENQRVGENITAKITTALQTTMQTEFIANYIILNSFKEKGLLISQMLLQLIIAMSHNAIRNVTHQ